MASPAASRLGLSGSLVANPTPLATCSRASIRDRSSHVHRRPRASDRVRIPIRGLLLYPTGGLPRHVSHARGSDRVRTQLRGQQRDPVVLRVSVRPSDDRWLQRVAHRWHARDRRRDLWHARSRPRTAYRRGRRPRGVDARGLHWPWSLFGSQIAAIAAGAVLLWLATFVGSVVGGLAVGAHRASVARSRSSVRVRSSHRAATSRLCSSSSSSPSACS